MEQGKVLIVTSPSGGGKTTIVRHLLKNFPQLDFSISACTRSKRPTEKEGVDYFFLSVDEFHQKVKAGDFLEWEEVYDGRLYGTLNSEVERLWEDKKVVLFDVDVKGAQTLKKHFGDRALAVFIKPPTVIELVVRLLNRGTETNTELIKRLRRVEYELQFEPNFDVVVINDELEVAQADAQKHVANFLGN